MPVKVQAAAATVAAFAWMGLSVAFPLFLAASLSTLLVYLTYRAFLGVFE